MSVRTYPAQLTLPISPCILGLSHFQRNMFMNKFKTIANTTESLIVISDLRLKGVAIFLNFQRKYFPNFLFKASRQFVLPMLLLQQSSHQMAWPFDTLWISPYHFVIIFKGYFLNVPVIYLKVINLMAHKVDHKFNKFGMNLGFDSQTSQSVI